MEKNIYAIYWLFLIMITSTPVSAQNNSLGLRLEFYTYNIEKVRNTGNYTSEYVYTYLPGFYIFYSHNVFENLSVSIRPGLIISDEDISGYDIGGYIRYRFPINKFYASGGLNFIRILNPGGGQSFIEDLNNSINFYSFALGYELNRNINLEISYSLPFDKIIGRTLISPDVNNLSGSSIKLNNMIKLNIEFISKAL